MLDILTKKHNQNK